MVRGSAEQMYEELFTYACPKFINAAPPTLDAPTANTNQVRPRLLHTSRTLSLRESLRKAHPLYHGKPCSTAPACYSPPQAQLLRCQGSNLCNICSHQLPPIAPAAAALRVSPWAQPAASCALAENGQNLHCP